MRGYSLGCRVTEECPQDSAGITCSDARAAYSASRARSEGIGPRAATADAAAAAQRIQQLIAAGFSLRAIAQMADVGRTTITSIHLLGLTSGKRIEIAIEKKILSLPTTVAKGGASDSDDGVGETTSRRCY